MEYTCKCTVHTAPSVLLGGLVGGRGEDRETVDRSMGVVMGVAMDKAVGRAVGVATSTS